MAHQRGIAGQGDGLLLHLEGLECTAAGFDVGDEFLLVLNLATGVAVGQVRRSKRVQFGDVFVQHRLGQVVDCLGNFLFRRGRGGHGICAEGVEKTDQEAGLGHVVSLLLSGWKD